jgi:hypothetical protein
MFGGTARKKIRTILDDIVDHHLVGVEAKQSNYLYIRPSYDYIKSE